MRFLLTIPFMLFSFNSWAGLSCSANGLNILYVNGVNVKQQGNQDSTNNVQFAINNLSNELDKKKVNPVKGVWNTSRGLLNDIEELKAQLAVNHQGKKRAEFWKSMARPQYNLDAANEAFWDEAIEQITSGKNIPVDKNGVIDQDYYSKTDFYKDLVKYNSSLANLLANAASDFAVVTEMKKQIWDAYKNGENKVIIISHSQGNEVAYSAINELRRDRKFLTSDNDIKKFDGLMGYMQVAPPSPRLITATDSYFNFYPDHAQYIRSDADAVIGGSAIITSVTPIPANYFTQPIVNGISQLINATSWWDKLSAPIYTGGSAIGHGMDDIYLNDNYYARREGTIIPKTMKSHFQDNMREIASKLESNCGTPIIKLTTTESTVDANGINQISGFANLNRTIELNVRDANPYYDSSTTTFSWKIIRNYPISSNKEFSGSVEYENFMEGSSYDLEIPYRDVTYDVVVTANHENNISTSTFKFAVKQNAAPSLTPQNLICNRDSHGYLSGEVTYDYKINDDQYEYDGKIVKNIVSGSRTVELSFYDGTNIGTNSFSNPCSIETPVYRYDYQITCQTVSKYYYCNYEPGCTTEQLNDTTIVNTGIQFTSVRVYDDKNNYIKTIDLADMDISGGAGFYDLNPPYGIIYAPCTCTSGL